MIEPMLATLVKVDLNLDGSWLIEPKYDGERLIAQCQNQKITLWTRRHIEVSSKFPEVVEALKNNMQSDNWILDGELTVSGGFRQLLKRNVEDKFKIKLLSRKMPATYNIFDMLRVDNQDLILLPLIERKGKLINSVQFNNRLGLVPFQEVSSENWEEKFKGYLREGFEGAVIKNTYSVYQPGKRSPDWLKVKKQDTVDVYVVGATKSTGSIPFGALILEKGGKFFGKVGTGFSDAERKLILKILQEKQGPLNIELPPDVESEILITSQPLLAEIRVQEIIKGSPRAPVWVRFRWE